jgi:TM2 domain-containing membrane protein YozV
MQYYIATDNQQRGPFPKEHLFANGLRPDTLIWTDGMGQWQRADSVADVATLFAPPAAPAAPPPLFNPQPGYATPLSYRGAPVSSVNSTKLAAGLCGIFLGGLGIHKFILGYKGAGITMLLVSICSFFILYPIMHLIGLIEGIVYLTKSDAEFYQTYVARKKAWF